MSPDAQRLAERFLIQSNEEAFSALEKECGEPEPGCDEWFRADVEQALSDKSPGISHEQVMQEIAELLTSARKKQRLKESA